MTTKKNNHDGERHIAFRLDELKTDKLNKILTSLDCTYGNKPSVGVLVKKILKGDIILTKVQ